MTFIQLCVMLNEPVKLNVSDGVEFVLVEIESMRLVTDVVLITRHIDD
jgi:hypothetical protein